MKRLGGGPAFGDDSLREALSSFNCKMEKGSWLVAGLSSLSHLAQFRKAGNWLERN